MLKTTYLEKKNRLNRLIGLLKSQDFWTTEKLSLKLGISHRTLMRDLNILQDMGIPLDTSKGRGGGVRINGRFGLSKLELSYQEIIDLLLALATIEKLKSSLLLQNMRSTKDKLAKAFPPEQRKNIEDLRKRIYIGELASLEVLNTYKTNSKLNINIIHEAFFNLSQIEITYRSEKKETLSRIIEPHYLVLNWPVWYILAWDKLRSDIRFFRIDRILKIQLKKESFHLHHKTQFRKQLETFSEYI